MLHRFTKKYRRHVVMTAIYVRQSIEKKDSISIESQIEKCLSEVKGEYEIYNDKGFSGKSIKRPAFLKLLQEVEEGKINKIVVYRLDRFSRSITDFSKIWQSLKKHHVEFVSVNEKFDTASPMGSAMLHIIMVFAQLERETISERVKDNYYMRAKSGAWTGGPAPFGFSIVKKNIKGKKISVLEVNQYIDIVIKIFQSYQKKEASLGSVAKQIKEISQCRKWDSVAISRILHNPVYAMCTPEVYYYYQSKNYIIEAAPEQFDGKRAAMILGKCLEKKYFLLAYHNGVIPAKLYLDCQHKLEKNKQLKNTGRGKYTFLSGLLKCGICGYSLKVVYSKGKRYFVCSGRSNYYIKHNNTSISLEELEESFEQEFCNMIQNNDILQKQHEIEQKINHLVCALSECGKAATKYINMEIEALEHEKKELKQYSIQTKQFFDAFSYENKKQIAQQFLEKIIVYEQKAKFYWKV